jgi:hypothetical protein
MIFLTKSAMHKMSWALKAAPETRTGKFFELETQKKTELNRVPHPDSGPDPGDNAPPEGDGTPSMGPTFN